MPNLWVKTVTRTRVYIVTLLKYTTVVIFTSKYGYICISKVGSNIVYKECSSYYYNAK